MRHQNLLVAMLAIATIGSFAAVTHSDSSVREAVYPPPRKSAVASNSGVIDEQSARVATDWPLRPGFYSYYFESHQASSVSSDEESVTSEEGGPAVETSGVVVVEVTRHADGVEIFVRDGRLSWAVSGNTSVSLSAPPLGLRLNDFRLREVASSNNSASFAEALLFPALVQVFQLAPPEGERLQTGFLDESGPFAAYFKNVGSYPREAVEQVRPLSPQTELFDITGEARGRWTWQEGEPSHWHRYEFVMDGRVEGAGMICYIKWSTIGSLSPHDPVNPVATIRPTWREIESWWVTPETKPKPVHELLVELRALQAYDGVEALEWIEEMARVLSRDPGATDNLVGQLLRGGFLEPERGLLVAALGRAARDGSPPALNGLAELLESARDDGLLTEALIALNLAKHANERVVRAVERLWYGGAARDSNTVFLTLSSLAGAESIDGVGVEHLAQLSLDSVRRDPEASLGWLALANTGDTAAFLAELHGILQGGSAQCLLSAFEAIRGLAPDALAGSTLAATMQFLDIGPLVVAIESAQPWIEGGNATVQSAVLGMLVHVDAEVRVAAVYALGGLAEQPTVRQALLELQGHELNLTVQAALEEVLTM